MRWFSPPPQTTAYFSSTRKVGVVLRVSRMIAPVPMHWLRLIRKRQNHAAVLARALARETGAEWCPDLLVRRAAGGTQDGRGREGRFANVAGAFAPHPRRGARAVGRHVLLIDFRGDAQRLRARHVEQRRVDRGILADLGIATDDHAVGRRRQQHLRSGVARAAQRRVRSVEVRACALERID